MRVCHLHTTRAKLSLCKRFARVPARARAIARVSGHRLSNMSIKTYFHKDKNRINSLP